MGEGFQSSHVYKHACTYTLNQNYVVIEKHLDFLQRFVLETSFCQLYHEQSFLWNYSVASFSSHDSITCEACFTLVSHLLCETKSQLTTMPTSLKHTSRFSLFEI